MNTYHRLRLIAKDPSYPETGAGLRVSLQRPAKFPTVLPTR